MQQGVPDELSQRFGRIVGLLSALRPTHGGRRAQVQPHELFDLPHLVGNGSADLFLIQDGIDELGAVQPKELDIGSGEILPGFLAQEEQGCVRGPPIP